MDPSNPESVVYPFQLTKTIHRDVYPYLDPSRAELSAVGKIVLVTGAAGGVGKIIAEAWCIAKASKVVITSRNQKALDEVASKLRTISSSTQVLVIPSDMTSEQSARELFTKAKSEAGTIDVVVSAAGTLASGKTGEISVSDWWRDFETNVKGFYLLTQEFLKHTGGKGTLIGVGTGAAAGAYPGMGSYISSKLAQQKFIEVVSAEYPELRAFTLVPGLPLTEMTLPSFVPFAKDDPMLSGGLSLFLATSQADWLKGQTVSINWDLEEMEANKEAIVNGQLTQLSWLKGQLQKGGHPF